MMSSMLGRGLILGLVSLVSLPGLAQGQDEKPLGWTSGLTGTIGFAQSEFENYAEGGESSLTWTSGLLFEALQYTGGREWKTTAGLEFGQTRLGDGAFRKSADRIEITSINKWLLDTLFPFVAVDARSQLAKSFAYNGDGDRVAEISRFGSPLYFNQSAGVGKALTPHLSTRLGLAVHEVFVLTSGDLGDAFAATFTDDRETAGEIEKSRVDAGLESVTTYEREFPEEKVKLKSELKLFSAFDSPDKIDVTWRSGLTAQLLSFISVGLNAEVLYDEDILNRTQLKEVLTLGVAHTFF